jgi:hypothetical protein
MAVVALPAGDHELADAQRAVGDPDVADPVVRYAHTSDGLCCQSKYSEPCPGWSGWNSLDQVSELAGLPGTA